MRNRWITIVAVLVIAGASSMTLAGPGESANLGTEKAQYQNMFQNRFSEFMGWAAQYAYGFGPGMGTGTCDQDCQGTGDCDCDGVGDQDQLRNRIHTPGAGSDPGVGNDNGGKRNGLRDGGGTGTCPNLL